MFAERKTAAYNALIRLANVSGDKDMVRRGWAVGSEKESFKEIVRSHSHLRSRLVLRRSGTGS